MIRVALVVAMLVASGCSPLHYVRKAPIEPPQPIEAPELTYPTIEDFDCPRYTLEPSTGKWFEVTDGLAAGANLQSFSSVTDRSVRFIKRSVARVIGSMPTWEMMYDEEARRTGEVRSSIEGRHVQITQKTNESNGKKFVNVYVDKSLGGAKKAHPVPEAPPAVAEDDEVDVDDLF